MKTDIPKQYKGLLSIAQLAQDNPQSFDFDHYDITPVDHDYAGQFQQKANYVFRKLGLSIGFIMMIGDPKNVAEIYDAFRKDPRYLGGGTGVGFKNRAPAVLDSLDPLAKQIEAVNVITKIKLNNSELSELRGFNTDGLGFVFGLEEFLKEKSNIESLKRLNILIIGAGGTANAIAFTLAAKGAKLAILNRTAEKAQKLAIHINQSYDNLAMGGGEELIRNEVAKADIVINTSTKSAEGSFKDFIAFAPARVGELEQNISESNEIISLLKPTAVVCDINLRADESPTLKLAQKFGHLVQDGSRMNFYQAVEALWLIHQDLFIQKGISRETISRLIDEIT